jgi:hypothetical protein
MHASIGHHVLEVRSPVLVLGLLFVISVGRRLMPEHEEALEGAEESEPDDDEAETPAD